MPIQTPEPRLIPLLRILAMPPSLARFATDTDQLPLRTKLIRDTPLAEGHRVNFDDTCRVTVAEGISEELLNVRLMFPGQPKVMSGLQLAILSPKGNIQLAVVGPNVSAFIGAKTQVHATAHLSGGAHWFVGDQTTMSQTRLFGVHADIQIGSDCQFHDEVVMQCSDPHPITDLDTGQVINQHRRKVFLGRHVLVGRRSLLLADLTVGEGAVISPGSVVSGEVGAGTQVGGSPATLIRPRVAWARVFGEDPPNLAD
ncbi:MAG: hypothetical protein C4K60_10865 [Ideonella sp. MAG2]|nr:MAG: hypothetical protein C4K60_10865 [Ideonella sp. MAG2]